MKITAFSVLGLLMVLGVAVAQQKSATPSGEEAELKALEQKWNDAYLKGDSTALDAILAETFISTDAEGKVSTKAETLAHLKSGQTKYQTSQVDDMKVSVYGDTAVVNGRWKGKFVEKRKPVNGTERFTDTYVRQNGQWRCVASHSSHIK